MKRIFLDDGFVKYDNKCNHLDLRSPAIPVDLQEYYYTTVAVKINKLRLLVVLVLSSIILFSTDHKVYFNF